MKISIIVPVYNKEKYINKCVDSLINQTHRDLEILLIDDGSKDTSGAICDSYSDADARVKTIHKENGGLVSAWKRGLEEATGDYISFVDSDDWIDLDMLEKLAAHTTARKDEIILSDYVIERLDGSKSYVYQNITPGDYGRDLITGMVFPMLFGLEDRAVCRSRCMKLFSAQLAKNNLQYGDERIKFGEDTSLTIPCVLEAGRLYFCDRQAMYHYLYVTDSMVHDYDPGLLESIQLVQEVTERAIKDKADSCDYGMSTEDMLELARKEYVFLLMYAIKNEAKGPEDTYIHRIKQICTENNAKEIIHKQKVKVRHASNKLVYMVMKNPTTANCKLLRMALTLWNTRERRGANNG